MKEFNIDDYKDKKICKLAKTLPESDPAVYAKIVAKPKYMCGKCGRVAPKKKMVCKPLKVKKLITEA